MSAFDKSKQAREIETTPSQIPKAISTSNDAVVSKSSIMRLNYIKDSFVEDFAKDCRGSGVTHSTHSLQKEKSRSKFDELEGMRRQGQGGSNSRLLHDPFEEEEIAPQRSTHTEPFNNPLINRGYYARVHCIDKVLHDFISNNKDTEINVVEVGAGKSTLFLRWLKGELSYPPPLTVPNPPLNFLSPFGPRNPKIEVVAAIPVVAPIPETNSTPATATGSPHVEKNKPTINWYEIDHPSVTSQKRQMILKSPSCRSLLNENSQHFERYHLLPVDFNDSDSSIENAISNAFSNAVPVLPCNEERILSQNLPTLIIIEAVLMYLPPKSSTKLLNDINSLFNKATICTYDCCIYGNPNHRTPSSPIKTSNKKTFVRSPSKIVDSSIKSFGTMMETNLKTSGLDTSGLSFFPTLSSHISRLKESGFEFNVVGSSMLEEWENVDEGEKRRVGRLEMLDEVEEWGMIMSVYCFIVSKNWKGFE